MLGDTFLVHPVDK